MKFIDTEVEGAYRIRPEPRRDARGSFARVWCEREFADAGIDVRWRQENVGFSHRRHTIRGIHFQRAPEEEAKLVRCTRGRVIDVAVDLRPLSPSYRRWTAAELGPTDGGSLFIPAGCGHAYLTLEDESEITYLTSAFYVAESASGARWDDPAFSIAWPAPPAVISDQDAAWPDWTDSARGVP
jgi:dTDP-4-dehydrorhamnose 3,5-epimerase